MKTTQTPLRADEHPVDHILWRINAIYCKLFHRFVWQGPDPIPKEGGVLLVCNHRSSVDPFILSASTRRIISFLIAEEYYRIPFLRRLFDRMGCIPVRRNASDASAVRKALRAVKEGHLVCIFPEGGIGKGMDHVKQGVGYLALRSGAPVIPAKITGTPCSRSIWISLLKRSRSSVSFGPPYYPTPVQKATSIRTQIAMVTDTITDTLKAL